MQYEHNSCPECGKNPAGHADQIPGTANLAENDDGDGFEFTGSTQVVYDGQTNEAQLRFDLPPEWVMLICPHAHRWLTRWKHEGDLEDLFDNPDAREMYPEDLTVEKA